MQNQQTGSLTQITLGKFKKDKLGMTAIVTISLVSFITIFCYFFTTDKTANANLMNIPLAYKGMAYQHQMLRLPLDNYTEKQPLSTWFTGKQIYFEELAIEKVKIVDQEVHYIPYLGEGFSSEEKVLPFSTWTEHGISPQEIKDDFIYTKTFLLGTDKYGRDFFSRLLIGTRISFLVGFIAVFISLFVGITLGALAGYYKGWVDQLIMWFINVIWSIPTLMLVMAITLALGKGFLQIFIAVGLTMWVEVARVVRGQFLSYREKEFVEAARALGFSDLRIIFGQILPNVIAPVIVIAAANFAAAILIESGLSFLGLGAQPPTPSWGNIIKEHYSHIILGHQHLAILPGVLIMLLVLTFNIFGNSLRDALDVKEK